MVSLKPRQVQFSYEVDFSPPAFELIAAGKQVEFVKKISESFNLKAADFVFAPQNIARGTLFFKRWVPEGGTFDVSFGADGGFINFFSPADLESAWKPVEKLIKVVTDSSETKCERQVLKFQSHCETLGVRAEECTSIYNVFQNELLTSKGATFNFKGPHIKGQTFFLIANSLLVPDGVFLLSEITYFQEDLLTRVLYDDAIKYLMEEILPLLGLSIII